METVELDSNGEPQLDYPLTDYLFAGAREALLAMAELQFAAGAKAVMPIHADAQLYKSWPEAKAAIMALPMAIYRTTLASAHVMGGCNMAGDATKGVVDMQGRHHQLKNLSVFDGSTLPTSLGRKSAVNYLRFGLAQQHLASKLAAWQSITAVMVGPSNKKPVRLTKVS